jgi:hypothetical protein
VELEAVDVEGGDGGVAEAAAVVAVDDHCS